MCQAIPMKILCMSNHRHPCSIICHTQATIAEVQRIAYIAPTSLPHRTTKPTVVEGFRFPEDSIFLANVSFMMNDPDFFDKPQEFNPDRFMTSDGR